MKKALVYASSSDTRIHEIADVVSPVHPYFKWVDVPDGTTTSDKYFNGMVDKYTAPAATKEQTIAAIENSNVVTQRGLREFVLAVAEQLPQLKSKAFFKVADDAEKLIAAEREKTVGLLEEGGK